MSVTRYANDMLLLQVGGTEGRLTGTLREDYITIMTGLYGSRESAVADFNSMYERNWPGKTFHETLSETLPGVQLRLRIQRKPAIIPYECTTTESDDSEEPREHARPHSESSKRARRTDPSDSDDETRF